jgi:hypothetical protein
MILELLERKESSTRLGQLGSAYTKEALRQLRKKDTFQFNGLSELMARSMELQNRKLLHRGEKRTAQVLVHEQAPSDHTRVTKE